MLTVDMKEKMQSAVLCWLGTVSPDGQPNVSPKEVWTSWQDQYILIANIASPQSVRNIARCPQVCVSFVDVFLQKGYQIKGAATIVRSRDEEFSTLAEPLKQIAGDKYPFGQLIKMKVSEIKEILAPSYVLYPGETDEESQRKSAYLRYGVRSA